MKNFIKILTVITIVFLSSTLLNAKKIIYIDSAATGALTGLNWTDAYIDFNTAFADAEDGDELWFAKGTYNGFNITPHSLDKDLSFYGGFANGETSLEGRNFDLNPVTFISQINNTNTPLFSIGTDHNLVFDGISFTRMAVLISQNTITPVGNRITIRNGEIHDMSGPAVSIGQSELVLDLFNVDINNNTSAIFNTGGVDSVIVDEVSFMNNSGGFISTNSLDYLEVNSSEIKHNTNSPFVSTSAIGELYATKCIIDSNDIFSFISASIGKGSLSYSKIRGNELDRFFTGNTIGDFVFDSLSIKNNEIGLISFSGINGEIIVDKCDIEENSGDAFFGGSGVLGSFKFLNSNFLNNTNDQMINFSGFGLGRLEIENGIISNNNSSSIFISGNIQSLFSIVNTKLDDNIASFSQLFSIQTPDTILLTNFEVTNGEADRTLFSFSSNDIIEMKNVNIDYNSTRSLGSMFTFDSEILKLDNVSISNNTPSGSSTVIALRIDESTVIKDSEINNNTGQNLFNNTNGASSFTLESSEIKNNRNFFTLVNTGSDTTNIINSHFEYNGSNGDYFNGDYFVINNSHFLSDTSIHNNSPYIRSENVEVNNSSFIGNYSGGSVGGAIFCNKGGTIKNSIFRDNFCNTLGGGGAIYCSSSDLEITDSRFENNSTASFGGAMATSNGSLKLRNILFEGNHAPNGGGAIYAVGSETTIEGSVFNLNSSDVSSSVLYCPSTCKINGSTFTNNTSNVSNIDGTINSDNLMFLGGNGASIISNSFFRNNSSVGDLISTSISTSLPIKNTLFADNKNVLGALVSAASIDFFNSTIVENETFRFISARDYNMKNSIMWSNDFLIDILDSDIKYSNIEGGYEGEGNLDIYPEFVDPENGDYRLLCTSPLINQGNNEFATEEVDFYGVNRITADVVDMGAFEFDGDPSVVNQTPVPSFTINSTETCIQENIEFLNNTVDTDNFTYFWDFGLNDLTSTGINPIQAFDEDGTYTVQLTATNGCGQTVTTEQEITINNSFVPSIQYETFVCPEDTVEFMTNTTCNDIVWSAVNGTVLDGQGTDIVRIIFDADGDGRNASVQLLATDCGGLGVCELPVEIEIPIIPTNQTLEGKVELCENEEVWYRPEFSESVPGVLYEWTVTGGEITSDARGYGLDSVLVEWGSAGAGELRLRTFTEATDSCSGGDSISVVIKPEIVLSSSLISCGESDQQITNNQMGTFTYSVDGSENTIDNSGLITWGNVAGFYDVVSTSNDVNAFCNTADTLEIQLVEKPVIDTILGEILVDNSSTYAYEVVTSNEGINYRNPTVTGGQLLTSGQFIEIIWNRTLPFSISTTVVSATGNCSSDAFVLPVENDFEFEVLGDDKVCVNTTAQFIANIDTSIASYTWAFEGDTILGTVTSPVFNFNTPRFATVSLIVEINGKEYTTAKEVFVDVLEANFNLTGAETIAPEGGGSYIYEFNNPNILDLEYEIEGSVSDALNASTIDVTWNTTGPYEIRLLGSKTTELCASDTVVLKVEKASVLNPRFTLEGGRSCVSDLSLFGFNADEFTENVEWSINNNAVLVNAENTSAQVNWPAVTGTYLIMVNYDRFETSFTHDTTITIDALPTPEIADVTICGERDTIIKTTEEYQNYSWFLEPENTLLTLETSVVTSEAGIYRVVVEDVNGCSGVTTKDVQQVNFPQPVILIPNNRLAYCPAEDTISISVETLENPAFIYEWKVDGEVLSDLSVFNFDLERTQKLSEKKISVIVSIPECTDSISDVFMVLDTCSITSINTCSDPVASFSVEDCTPFVFEQTSGRTDTIIDWSFGDGTTASGTMVNHTYSTVGRFVATMKAGCRVTSQRIEVPLVVDFSFPQNVCSGTEVDFRDFSLNLPGSTIISYEWDFGDTETEFGTTVDKNTSHIFASGGSYEVSLKILAENTGGDICEFIKTQTITVNDSPDISFSAAAPDCEDPTYFFTNTTTQATLEASYSWELDGIPFTQKNVAFTYSDFSNLTKDVSLRVTDFVGCSSILDTTIDIISPILKQDISVAGVTHLCFGDSVKLSAPTSPSYEWYVNDESIDFTNNQEYYANKGGIYNVRYEVPECIIFSTDLEITSFEPITTIVEDDINCLDENIQLELQDLPDDVTISWTKDGSGIISTSNRIFISGATLADAGTYEVTLREEAITACEFTLPTFDLDIFELPSAPLVSLTETRICFDESVTATVNNFNALSTYEFIAETTKDTISSAETLLSNLQEDISFTILTTDLNGCSSTSELQEIIVNPEADNILAGPSELCQYEYLEVKSSLNNNQYDFEWFTLESGTLPSTTNSESNLVAELANEGNYYSVATTNSNAPVAGCEFISDTLFVDILSAPVKPSIVGDDEFCEGDIHNLSIASTTDQILWNTGVNTEAIDVRQGGLYSVTLTNTTTGCEASDLLEVTENPLPVFNFVATGFYELCGNEAFELEGLDQFSNFQWKLNGNTYGNENVELVPRQSGNYTVEVETFAGCNAESDTLRIVSEPCGACEVISVSDAIGVGSLRDAIICANDNKGVVDFIVFNIPGSGDQILQIDSMLPTLEEGVIINGFSQTATGIYDIIIEPGLFNATLFEVEDRVDDLSISGLVIRDFERVLDLGSGAENTQIILNQFENNEDVIVIDQFSRNTQITDNIFTGGQAIDVAKGDELVILRNEFIGTNQALKTEESEEVTFSNNYVTGNTQVAVELLTTSEILVDQNEFGTDTEGNIIGNASTALKIDSNAIVTNNNFVSSGLFGLQIGGNTQVRNNTFLNTASTGIRVEFPKVTIIENTFVNSDDSQLAIDIFDNGNIGKLNFGISSHELGSEKVTLSGFGISGDSVEIFKSNSSDQQALETIGFAIVESGSWSYTIEEGSNYTTVDTSYYVTTLTDLDGNTTELSGLYKVLPFICGGVVNNINDDGPGSFRREVECANLDPDFSNILFDLDTVSGGEVIVLESRVEVIYPVSIFANLTDSITIQTDVASYLFFFEDSDSSSVAGLIFDGVDKTGSSVNLQRSDKFSLSNSIIRNSGTAFVMIAGTYNMDNVIFESNKNIFNVNGVDEGIISNSIFRNNETSLPLGSGFSAVNKHEIINCYFYGNTDGAVIDMNSPDISIENSHFGITETGEKNLNAGRILRASFFTRISFINNEVLSEGLSFYSRGDDNIYSDNYFGLSKNGLLTNNTDIGFTTEGGSIVRNNVFGNFDDVALEITGSGSVIVESNLFGVDNLMNSHPNFNAITVTSHNSAGTRISNNTFGYSNGNVIELNSAAFLTIDSNYFGIDKDGVGLPNEQSAISSNSFSNIMINNIFANHDSSAIKVSNRGGLISNNIFFNNPIAIEHIAPNGNNLHPMPVMDSTVSNLTSSIIYGHAQIGDVIEIYRNDNVKDHALELLDEIVVDPTTGVWLYSISSIVDEAFFIATATDSDNNTSEFSEPYIVEPFFCTGVVTNTKDAGNGSLRREVECANLDPDHTTILFDLDGITGEKVIALETIVEVIYPVDIISSLSDSIIIAPTTNAPIRFNSLSSSTNLVGLVLDGENAGVDASAIISNGAENFTLSNTIIRNYPVALAMNGTKKYTVSECEFSNLDKFIEASTGGDYVLISNNNFKSIKESIDIGWGTTNVGVEFVGNNLFNSSANPLVSLGGDKINIIDNIFGLNELGEESINTSNELISQSKLDLTDVKIIDNTFLNSDTAVNLSGSQIEVHFNRFGQSSNGVTVEGKVSVFSEDGLDIQNNLFVNQVEGINITSTSSNGFTIKNNSFGVDSSGVEISVETGVIISVDAINGPVDISKNAIVYATVGMELESLSDSLIVTENLIGRSSEDTIGSVSTGVIMNGSNEQIILLQNEIRNCDTYGIAVNGLHNHITGNVIQDWGQKGIHHFLPDGNALYPAPEFTNTIGTFSELSIAGSAEPFDKIELFRTDSLGNNAFQLFSTVFADNTGQWKFSFENVTTEIDFIATATDESGNTSEFSDAYHVIPYLCTNIVVNTDNAGNGSLRRAIACSPYIQEDIFVEIDGSLEKEIVLEEPLPVFAKIDSTDKSLTLFGEDRIDQTAIRVIGDQTFSAIHIRGNRIEDVIFEKFDTVLVTLEDQNGLKGVEFNEFNVGLYASKGTDNLFEDLVFNDGSKGAVLEEQNVGKLLNSSFGDVGLISEPIYLNEANEFNVQDITIGNVGTTPVEVKNSENVVIDNINGELSNTIPSFIHCDGCFDVDITGDSLVGSQNGVVMVDSRESRISNLRFVGQEEHAIALQRSEYIQFDRVTTREFAIDQKIINLNYGATEESNQGYAIPSFESATYRSRVIYFKGKSAPSDVVQIYKTELDTTDAREFHASVTANSLGVFEFEFPVTLENFNDISFRAFSTESLSGTNSDKQASNSSEFTDAYNPNLKICFVTSESDDGTEKGTMRYNIDSLVNEDKCNLMLFEVPTSIVNLEPETEYSAITGGKLTIDGTSQPGYSSSPVVKILNTSNLDYAYTIDNDTSEMAFQALSYEDFDTALVIENVKTFENTLGQFTNFNQSIQFLDSTTTFIQLESNVITSERADYLVETTVPNVIIKENEFIGGNIHGLKVSSDTLLTDGNTFRPLNDDSLIAVFSEEQSFVNLTNDKYLDYKYGIHINNMGAGVTISENEFLRGQKVAILVTNDNSSLIEKNRFVESDTAISVWVSDSSIISENVWDNPYNGDGVAHTGLGIVVNNSEHIELNDNKFNFSEIAIVLKNSDENSLTGNISQGHDSCAIFIDSLSNRNVLNANILGTTISVETLEREAYLELTARSIQFESDDSVFSRGYGIYLEGDSNYVGTSEDTPNIIYRNEQGGIAVKGQYNKIMFNAIAKNDTTFEKPDNFAVEHKDSIGNSLKKAPIVDSYETVEKDEIYKVWGESEPGDTVQLFNSNGYYQSTFGYLAETVANDTGYWEVNVNRDDMKFSNGLNSLTVVALATDDSCNTSELSNMIYVGSCYVGNNIDNLDNANPYPNSLRQAVTCLNSLPEKDQLLVAKPDDRSIGIMRQMIDLKNPLGAVIDGRNLFTKTDSMRLIQAFVDSVGISDTAYVWRLDTLFGESEFKNVQFSIADTALVMSSDSVTAGGLKFTTIGKLAIHIDTSASNILFNEIEVSNSLDGTAIFMDKGSYDIDIQRSTFNYLDKAITSFGSRDLIFSQSEITFTTSPAEMLESNNVGFYNNKIDVTVDPLIFQQDSNLVFSGNKIEASKQELILDVSQSDTISILDNEIGDKNERIIKLSEVTNAIVSDNKVEEVTEYFALIDNSINVDVLGNEIERFTKRGVWVQNSDSVWMADNLFKGLNATENEFIGILDIDKGLSSVSNEDIQTPTIDNHVVKLEGGCSEKEKTSIYLQGTASDGDTIQLFISEEFEDSEDYRVHKEVVKWGKADENGDWEIKLPRESYSLDPAEVFTYSVTATALEDVRTSRESDNYSFNDAHLKVYVTNTLNGGPESLRDAITQINCSDVFNKVIFQINADGPHQIEVTDSVLDSLDTYLGFIMDGATQNEFALSESQMQWDNTIQVGNSFYSSPGIATDTALFRVEKQAQSATFANLTLKDAVFAISPRNSSTALIGMDIINTVEREDTNSTALRVSKGVSINVSSSRFSGYHTPIILEETGGNVIANSVFENSVYGISIDGGTGLNQIFKDTFDIDSIAVVISNTEEATLIDTNNFTPVSALDQVAVWIDNSSNTIIANSRIMAAESPADTTLAIYTITGASSSNIIAQNIIGIDSTGQIGDKVTMNLLRLVGTETSTGNTLVNNEIINLSVPAIVASGTEGLVIQNNFFGFDEEQRLPQFTAEELAALDNAFLHAPGSDSTMVVLEQADNANILSNTFINYNDYAVDIRKSEGVSVQFNKMFSERTLNKAIQLNHEDDLLASNVGFNPPAVLDNKVKDELTIELTGVSEEGNVDVLIYEAYVNELDSDSILKQSFRYITSVTSDENGDWVTNIPTSNFGFTEFNRYVVQARRADQSTTEFGEPYKSESDLCNLDGNVIFFNDLYEPCPGSDFELLVPIAGAQYDWQGVNSEDTFVSENQNFELDTTAFVTLKMTDDSDCSYEQSFDVVFKPSPVEPEFLVTDEAGENDTIVVVDISNYVATPEDEFIWTVTGESEIISDSTNFVTFIVATTGTYEVTQSSQRDGCKVDLTKSVTVVSGGGTTIQPELINNSMTPYPNPLGLDGDLTIDIESASTDLLSLSIINLQGTVVYTYNGETILEGENSYQITIPRTAFEDLDAVYILRMTTPTSVITKSIIVMKTTQP